MGELSTILGSDSDFEGKLVVKQSMRIDGRVKGEVTSSETITLGSSGSISGEITAENMIMGGRVEGTINISGKTVLEKTSVLNGDLKTAQLVVEEGARFNGNCAMGETGGVSTMHPPRKIKLSEEE